MSELMELCVSILIGVIVACFFICRSQTQYNKDTEQQMKQIYLILEDIKRKNSQMKGETNE